MNALKMQTSRPLAARRCSRPQTTRAVPIQTKRSYTADKVFVGQPFLEKRQQPVGLAPLPLRNSAAPGDAGSAGKDEKLFLGRPMSVWVKIAALGFMFFCILFNYTILRDTKDVLVVTAPGSGAEIIPFLKTWVNLPAAIAFTVGYAQLSNMLTQHQLFYVCIVPFIAFFGAFAFFLYPNVDALHPTQFCIDLLDKAGERFAGPIAILRNWTFCLFYVMAELWGSVVVSVLFWGFANTITKVDEAEQFYPFFGLGANVALIFSGQAVRLMAFMQVAFHYGVPVMDWYFSDVRSKLPPDVDGWGYSLRGMMSMVVGFGALIILLREYLERSVVQKQAGDLPVKKSKKKKANMSVGESFVFLAKSTYIRSMATLVVAYGISINLVEVTWKSKLKAQYPNPNDYSTFMGNFSTATGAVTFCMMILSSWIFKRFNWGIAALITPIMLATTGILFFALVLCSEPLTPMLAGIGLTPLLAAVLVGAAQNVFSKGAKYALFDPCKEMAYIPLDEEVRVKGKGAIDVICNPLGKSGGALIQQFMIVGFGSLAASTPYLGVILLIIIFMWIRAAATLGVLFEEKQKEKDVESTDDGPATATA